MLTAFAIWHCVQSLCALFVHRCILLAESKRIMLGVVSCALLLLAAVAYVCPVKRIQVQIAQNAKCHDLFLAAGRILVLLRAEQLRRNMTL